MRILLCFLALGAVSACAASGAGTGLVTSRSGLADGTAQVSFRTRGGAMAELEVVLPDGERFSGPAVSGSRQHLPGVAFGTGRRDVLIMAPGAQWTGEILATLSSAAGRTMQCELTEKKVGLGLEGGAIGSCQLSDGRQIQIGL